MSGNNKKIIAFNYFGGKFTFLDSLYQYFPQPISNIGHFVDVFGGSAVVTLNKPFSKIDTYNDINDDVVNFFKVLRSHPDELIHQLKHTPVAREEYNQCYYTQHDQITDLEKARGFYVRSRQSFYGLGAQKKNKGWHMVKTLSRSRFGESVSKWHNGIKGLQPVIDKLSHIQIEKRDFRYLIPIIDFKDAFFYCDPPYTTDVRSGTKDYKFDFNVQDHIDLKTVLDDLKGLAMVSNYDGSELLEFLYDDWTKIVFPPKKNNIGNTRKSECIYINYDPAIHCGQTRKMFSEFSF